MMPTAVSTLALQIVAAIFLIGSTSAQISAGYATYSNGGGGVCSGGSSSLPAVAMNAAQFANGAACGQCIQITGSGNGAGTSPVSTAPYIATINNVCPQCSFGDIDLQESGNGKYGISWSFVGCPGGKRKLMNAPFQGDTTVYTGFAHMGKIAASEPVASAPEEASEQMITTAEDVAYSGSETEGIVKLDEDSYASGNQEAPAETVITENDEEASQGHLETATKKMDGVQASRRLLKTV